MRWVESYMGIPFKIDGMDRRGLNCYGLLRLVLAERFGVDIPPYSELTAAEMIAASQEIEARSVARPWLPIEPGQEREGDAVVMRALVDHRQIGEGHVGVVTQPGWLLHIERFAESVHVPFRDGPGFRAHLFVKRRVIRLVRHEALA